VAAAGLLAGGLPPAAAGNVRGGLGLRCVIDLVRSKEEKQAWDQVPFIKAMVPPRPGVGA
jgi:hypothetical protein